ncbi:hypothetical protein M011DRAFT_29692 [Sporormia fimetaria CBS 119925]|uniref:DUF3112 domain-containing protein n=1 Tax=Sporormia fimetaria CBS 119925 TaxID=1340428 RepID=A0A6A6VE98_9PLEO|nr:hypothetical protein M011DRAFT_29692 [Sporormia fimetaria CBS 119925]
MSASSVQARDGSQPQGPPYPPRTVVLGGVPDILPDIPVCSVFLALYVFMGVWHQGIFINNSRKGRKFVFSGAVFGFCMLRTISMCLRIAWACHRTSIPLGIAAQVFVFAGTMILFIVNWFFAQRIVRAQHPKWGWSPIYRAFHILSLVVLVLNLLMLIVAAVGQFYISDSHTLQIFRGLLLAGQTYFAAFCVAPIVLVVVSVLLPHETTESFGGGLMVIKLVVLLVTATVVSVGVVFRCIVAWQPPTPIRNSQGLPNPVPWYLSKACFYTFSLTTEAIAVIGYAIGRIDIRFIVPNGAKGPGSYSAGRELAPSEYAGSESTQSKRDSGIYAGRNQSSDSVESMEDEKDEKDEPYQYASSIVEIDPRSGQWKKKEAVRPGSSSRRSSLRSSHGSSRELPGPQDAPPVPPVPSLPPSEDSTEPKQSWPLPEPETSEPVLERNQRNAEVSSAASTKGRSSDKSSDQTFFDAIETFSDTDSLGGHGPNSLDRHHHGLADISTMLQQNRAIEHRAESSERLGSPLRRRYIPLDDEVNMPSDMARDHAARSISPDLRTSSRRRDIPSNDGLDNAADESFRNFSFTASPRRGDWGR